MGLVASWAMAQESLSHLHIFILAGGSGERFWPMSRAKVPKHLLRLLGDKTLLEMTVRRMEGLVPWERVFVLTNATQAEAVRQELPFLAAENVIVEPEKRDTAPACALATGWARARDPEAICALLPADAMIHEIAIFQEQLAAAAEVAATREALVTFGITPSFAATGFGYLHLGPAAQEVTEVRRFVEKPDEGTAEEYLKSGEYAWNAGMFLWKAEVFLGETERQSPPLAAFIREFPAEKAEAYLAEKFCHLPKISVDYAILENAAKVLAIPAKFDWDDVGSWTALPDHLGRDKAGNTLKGQVIQIDARNNVVVAADRLVALCGVQDLIVVETPDAILICHRDAAQEIKKLQPLLPEENR